MHHTFTMKRGRSTYLHVLLLAQFISLFYTASAQEIYSEGMQFEKKLFKVGVVLDLNTTVGKIIWSCMKMAISDFYSYKEGTCSNVTLYKRDFGGDSFGAALAVIDLLNNVQVKAIIGSQNFDQASIVMELGTRAQVPIISLSARSPPFSTQKSYFIRSAFDDSTQVQVIASLFREFNWPEAVPVYVDDEYGNGIIPELINAFQKVDVRVSYRSSIPPSSTDDDIKKELIKLKEMQTRVFVVHMTFDLGLQLFTIANEVGMMKEGYVWITTYGLTDIVNVMSPDDVDKMHGVLGVRPYVSMDKTVYPFTGRWRKSFHEEYPNINVIDPIVFGLWAYDAVRSLAEAAEYLFFNDLTFQVPDIKRRSNDISRIGSSSVGPDLLSFLKKNEFIGMSGRYRIVNGRLECKEFEILNVLKYGSKTVGLWTMPDNISGRRHALNMHGEVVWPGETRIVPKGWEWPRGKKLKVGVPVKPGFPDIIGIDEHRTPKGYCIEVFEAVMENIPDVVIEYHLYEYANGSMKGTYDELIYQVYNKHFDAVVGDMTITATRSLYVDFTLPFTESGVAMLVPIKDNQKDGAWAFLEPLTIDLWLASGALFIFTGFIVWLIEHRINKEFRGEPKEQLVTALYFSFSTLFFTHRQKVLSNLSRVIVIVWLFVIFVLQSSYTANLSNMLTVQRLQATVTDLNDLIKGGNNVGYLAGSFTRDMLIGFKFNKSQIFAYSSPEAYNDALSNGIVAAIIDEIPYLKISLKSYCGKYAMIGTPYKTDGFGFAFPKNSLLVSEVSRQILKLLESDKMVKIENTLYGTQMCPTPEESNMSSSSVSFGSFWGLFLITGTASMASLVLYLAYFLYRHRDYLRSLGTEHSIWRKLVFLAQLYDQMESPDASNEAEPAICTDDIANPVDLIITSAISGPLISSNLSNLVIETSESEEEIGDSSNEEMGDSSDEEMGVSSEEEEASERVISSQNPDPPSFADMLVIVSDLNNRDY